MKKSFQPKLPAIIIAVLLIVSAIVVNSCRKEIHRNSNTSGTDGLILDSSIVTQARQWYQAAYPHINTNKIATQSIGDTPDHHWDEVLTPYWAKAQMFMQDSLLIIEIPALKKGDLAFSKNKANPNNFDFTKSPSITSILIVVDQGHIGAYAMTIMGDSTYINSNYNKLKNNTYRKKDNNFSGYVFYNEFDGTFVNGWRYSNGKVVGPISQQPVSTGNQGIQDVKKKIDVDAPTGGGCYEIVTEYWENCTYWENDTYDEHPISCEYYTTSNTYGIPCSDDGGGGGDGNITVPPLVKCQPPNVGVQSINGRLKINVAPPPPGGGSGSGNGTTTTQQQCPDTTSKTVDPCVQAKALTTMATNATIAVQNKSILNSTLSTGYEYGANQNLVSWPGSTFLNTPITTQNNPTGWNSNFTWNSVNGYTMGFSHGHPGKDAPSPSDVAQIIYPIGNSSALLNAGAAALTYYEKNAFVAAISSDGTYLAMVNDWTTAGNIILNSYVTAAQQASFDVTYKNAAKDYLNNNADATPGDETAYALMQVFSNSITVYFAPAGSTTFKALTVSTDANGNATIALVDCPQ